MGGGRGGGREAPDRIGIVTLELFVGLFCDIIMQFKYSIKRNINYGFFCREKLVFVPNSLQF